ncbi:MAG: VOC family protein [Erythrobacter sp.]
MTLRPFHLAFPVDDLATARAFYGDLLGCDEGRSSDEWIDFNFHGHQITAHLSGETGDRTHNAVDGHEVPIPHFGIVLTMEDWRALAERLEAANTDFVMKPTIRWEGKPGEQATMFLRDPAGNALEFKALANMNELFAK